MIYLDNAATTQVSNEVFNEMLPFIKEEFGNPSAKYSLGLTARNAIDVARERVATLINASPENIIFTSGGSESNSSAIFSLVNNSRALVSSEMEHDSILDSPLINFFIPHKCSEEVCQEIGAILDHIEKSYCHTRHRVDIANAGVSMMFTNNELGFNNDIEFIGQFCKNNGLLFHTDCIQSLGHEYINIKKIQCDMMSMSSHKIHGPKGVGALYINDDYKHKYAASRALITGSQEQRLRGGTENVAGIVGFGKACEIANRDFYKNREVIKKLRKTFIENLSCKYIENYQDEDSKILSIRFEGVDSETLVFAMSSEQVYISSGSACRNLSSEPNATLLSFGLSEKEATETIRISFSPYNSIEEVAVAAKKISDVVNYLS